MGSSNNHYLDKCVLIEVVAVDEHGQPIQFRVRWLSKKDDWETFQHYADTAAERRRPEEIKETCLCFTRSWFLLLARKGGSDAWSSGWEAWEGREPPVHVMRLYDHVVLVEGLHMCIGNALAATHEFGCVRLQSPLSHLCTSPTWEGIARRLARTGLGKKGVAALGRELDGVVPELPRELRKWGESSESPKKPPWSFPRCVRSLVNLECGTCACSPTEHQGVGQVPACHRGA